MNQNTERSIIWKALKAAGWKPEEGRGYIKYPLADLHAELERFQNATGQVLEIEVPSDVDDVQPTPSEPIPAEVDGLDPDSLFAHPQLGPPPAQPVPTPPVQLPPTEPLRQNRPNPDELPGQRTLNEDAEVIRIDDAGRMWYQEEVRKPAYAKPRGRRILRYVEKGVQTETVKAGEYVESFEVEGQGPGKAAEIKITLPSYQVGIYKDPRFPFKIHCYGGSEAFDLADVEQYYGGVELVPSTIKRVYIENDLCYDIRSVIQTIQAEFRQLQLTGRIGS
jgi:hypothetical protein